MVGEVLDHRQGRSRLLEGVEDQPDRLLDLFIGIEDDLARRVVDQPRGWPEAELADRAFSSLPPSSRDRIQCSSASLMVPRIPRSRRSLY